MHSEPGFDADADADADADFTATAIATATPVHIAILAKAPLAGFAKTRLIPALGAHGAARLQRTFILRTVQVAQQARLGGGVQLWCAPGAGQRFFRALQRATGVQCSDQPAGDLGQRMAGATAAAPGPVLLVGTDCPALTVQHLRTAAAALRGGAAAGPGTGPSAGPGTGAGAGTSRGAAAVYIPAEDGGYVLVGLRQPQPGLFQGIDWSTERVMAQTRQRAHALGVALHELAPLWDVDTPDDLARLAAAWPAWPGHGR